MEVENHQTCLVRFAENCFFRSRTSDGQAARGTLYMSFGKRMTYLTAVQVAEFLRAMGYPDAIVCNLYGVPIDATNFPSPVFNVDEFVSVWADDSESVEPYAEMNL